MQQPAKLCTGNRVLGSNPSLSATIEAPEDFFRGFLLLYESAKLALLDSEKVKTALSIKASMVV